MNIITVAKKEFTVSPESDLTTIKAKVKAKKYIVLFNEEKNAIDKLDKTLDILEQASGKALKHIIVFGNVSQEHQEILEKQYSRFAFNFIYLV